MGIAIGIQLCGMKNTCKVELMFPANFAIPEVPTLIYTPNRQS